MREILFRGRATRDYMEHYASDKPYIKKGDWLFGNLIIEKSQYANGYYIKEIEFPFRTHEVDPKTVGQYTGLKDKSGVKIFEDDIMSINQYGNVLVEIQDGCAGAFADGGFIPFRKSIWGVGGVVVGNIHDNPELLEVE